MGTFKTHVGVSDGNGGAVQQIEALVDTGATYTVLPASLLRDRIGIQPQVRRLFTLADGREMMLPVGQAWLSVQGAEAYSPVVFAEDDGTHILGATTLQTLGLIADTTNHRLIPAPILYI